MFDKIENVPLVLAEFYHEDLVSEPLLDEEGNLVLKEETYEYIDENGDTQIGTRLVQVYHDVPYVVENTRNDLKSWDFVDTVIERKGAFEFITYCINKAVESEKWNFHDTYIKWLLTKPDPEDSRYLEADEEGTFLYSYEADLASWNYGEPKAVVTDANTKIEEYTTHNAIQTRYDATYQELEVTLVSGVTKGIDVGAGKDGVLGIENVKDALTAYNAGMVTTGSTYWIMADNSVEEITIADLNQIVINFNMRKQEIFNKYGLWRSGDKLTPFVL